MLSKVYICPEMDCSNAEEGKKGQICPKCGKEYQKMTGFQANNLKAFKYQIRNEKIKREEKENKKNLSKALINDDTSFEEINAKIYADINWEKFEGGSDVQPIITGLKVIIEQNKLIIKQNELIYRELKRINHKSNE